MEYDLHAPAQALDNKVAATDACALWRDFCRSRADPKQIYFMPLIQ